MRRKMIEEYIKKLSEYVGNPRAPISFEQLEKMKRFHVEKNYKDIIVCIHDTLNLQHLNLGIFFTVSDRSRMRCACMSIQTLHNPPEVRIRAKDSFVAAAPPETFIRIAAHELSHTVLSTLYAGKPTIDELEDTEVAVDLLAMMLGYREIFCIGNGYQENVPLSFSTLLERLRCSEKPRVAILACLRFVGFYLMGNKTTLAYWHVGYLTPEEVQFATNILDRMFSETESLKANR